MLGYSETQKAFVIFPGLSDGVLQVVMVLGALLALTVPAHPLELSVSAPEMEISLAVSSPRSPTLPGHGPSLGLFVRGT